MTAPTEKSKNDSPNWSSFYEQLGITGPKFLTGVSPGFQELVEFEARVSDSFWSDSLEEILASLWDQSPELAVRETVKEWANNVKEHLISYFGPDSFIPFSDFKISDSERIEILNLSSRVKVDFRKELVEELVHAAKEREEADAQENVADILIQGVIQPYEKHAEGMLIRAIEIPWRKIIGLLEKDSSVGRINCGSFSPRKIR